ncbi:unnamed protein product [Camellia sinensis]
MTSWRYKVGLFLIAAVVIIGVSSVEVTQDDGNDSKCVKVSNLQEEI